MGWVRLLEIAALPASEEFAGVAYGRDAVSQGEIRVVSVGNDPYVRRYLIFLRGPRLLQRAAFAFRKESSNIERQRASRLAAALVNGKI